MIKKYILISIFLLILTPILIYSSLDSERYYFGYITYLEKGCKIKRSISPQFEEPILNYPVIPGDEIYTNNGRCEIQFDNGTIVRLDKNAELKVETILAQSLTSKWKITTLLLKRGNAYVMNKNYKKELFQFITPNAAIKLKDNSVSKIEVNKNRETYFQVIRGKGYIKYGPDEKKLKERKVNKSERVFVNSSHNLIQEELIADTDFDLWNEVMNEHFREIHWGRSKIPGPIYKFPKAVIYFAEKYSSYYGEWIYSDLFGYVWKPYFQRYYPSGWMPYMYGRWIFINGQLFWVPAEPWGWVPYHFGVWHWTPKWGWIWIPGSAFHFGMVDWFYSGLYVGWRPWTLWDYWYWYGYWSYPDYYYWYAWYHDRYGRTPEEDPSPSKKPIKRKITKDELKSQKKKPYTLPKEYKKIVKNLIFSSEKLKKAILLPPDTIAKQFVFIKKKDLLSPELSNKVIPYSLVKEKIRENILNKSLKNQIFSRYLVRRSAQLQLINSIVYSNKKPKVFEEKIGRLISKVEKITSILPRNFNDVLPELQESPALKERILNIGRSRTAKGLRFRDWNPDVKWAIRRGLKIVYSSNSNEIVCPSLGISSSTVSSGSYSISGSFHSSGSRSVSSRNGNRASSRQGGKGKDK